VIHPLFPVILRRPELLARHLLNHVDLLRAEFAEARRAVVLKAVAGLAAGMSLLLALGLSALAVMLSVVERFHWALVAVPGLEVPLKARPREHTAFRSGEEVGVEIDLSEVLVFAIGAA